MLTITALGPAAAARLFPGGVAEAGMSRARWEQGCNAGRFLVFLAERGEGPVGFAVASSSPRQLRVAALAGEAGVAAPLLERVTQAAGERDVSAWCPADHPWLGALLNRRGFARVGRSDDGGPPAFLYHLSRNDEV